MISLIKRSIVKFVKSSTNLTKELQQINLGISEDEIKKLILDVKMKWNSIFYMIKQFVKLWNVINILIAKDKIPEILERRVHIEGDTGFIETGIRDAGIFSRELL